ncbi:MAG TPA: hypothetical protein PLD55_04030 [bacterium]|nr:hypothetical protein [bacterium]HOG42881.1 hypothetical protein [bacterium]HQM83832.1 hypothetical protein [bacterium]
MKIIFNEHILTVLLLFTVYSFLGWIIEVIYRFIIDKKLLNPGFFYGPYLPIYGFSALAVTFMTDITGNCVLVILSGTLFVTLLEYIAGTVTENYFGMKLWDYSDEKFNIKGRICLKYSVLWAILITIFIFIIHPYILKKIVAIPFSYKIFVTVFLSGIYFHDIILTTLMILNIKKFIEKFNSEEITFDLIKAQHEKLSRIMNSFPDIGKKLWKKYNKITEKNAIRKKSKNIAEIIEENCTEDPAYNEIVSDILENPDFCETMNYKHHHSSVFEHNYYVSYYSYKLAKKFKLDFRSTARGALMHDFFLYDWHTDHPEKGDNHGKEHPKTALRNAKKHFSLNKIEEDIIINHMWPYTKTFPSTKEALVVLAADKYFASKELFKEAESVLGKNLEILVSKMKKNRKKQNN